MAHGWLLKPKFVVLVSMLLMLAIAVACGKEATPTPAQAPAPALDEAAIKSLVEEAVMAQPEPVSAAEIEKIIKAAIPPTSTPAPTVTPAPTATPAPVATAVPPAPPTVTPRPVGGMSEPTQGSIVPMAASGKPLQFDPHPAIIVESQAAFSPLYNQLFEYNPVNPTELIGDLVKSWEVSDDNLVYTFRIHEGVKWTDGKDLTADDVVFSINRMIAPGEPRPNVGKIRSYVDQVEKLDQHTVKVQLKFPSGAFLAFLGVDYFKVVPKHVVEAGVDLGIFENAVGSGPFKYVSYSEGDAWEVERNPDYFKEGLPYFDGIQAFIILDKGAEIAAYKTERVLMDITAVNHLDIEDILRLENDQEFRSKFDFWGPQQCCAMHILLNTKKSPFDDERVRRALFLALDRQEIVEGFGLGKWRLGAPFLPRNPYAISQEELKTFPGIRQLIGKKHPDDIAEALKLMNEAGYGPDNPLKTTMYVGTIVQFPDMAQVIKQQFKNTLGIDITLILADLGSTMGRYANGDYEMGLFGTGSMILDPDDVFSGIYLDTSRNWTGWTHPKIDELFEKQQRESDPIKRKEIVQEMERFILVDNTAGYLWLATNTFTTVVSNRIKTKVGHYVQSETLYTILKHEHEWLVPK